MWLSSTWRKTTVDPSQGFWGPAWTCVPFLAWFLWEPERWGPKETSPLILYPSSRPWSSHVCCVGAWSWKICLPLWDQVAGAGLGGEWVGGASAATPPSPLAPFLSVAASREGRGRLRFLSGVLIRNFWESCNWLKWDCRVIYGLHLMMLSRNFPCGPVIKTPCLHYMGEGSIPGQGTKSAVWWGQNKNSVWEQWPAAE